MINISSDFTNEPPLISGRTIYRKVIPALLGRALEKDMSIHEAFEAMGESVANWLMAREGIVVDNLGNSLLPLQPISALEWMVLAYSSGYEAPAALTSTYVNFQKRSVSFLNPRESFKEDEYKKCTDTLLEIVNRQFLTCDEIYIPIANHS
jgi:hypothetical protein